MDRRCFLNSLGSLPIAAALTAQQPKPPASSRVVKPRRLASGDTVALVAPASATFNSVDLDIARESLQALGLTVKVGKHLLGRHGYLAGSDRDRAADINAFFADASVRAVLPIRGGWGSSRVLPYLDFALIQKRLQAFDFDLFTIRVPGREAPGAELLDRYGSRSADTQGSSNLIGVKDPAVEAILGKVVSSASRPELIANLRSLDRLLRHGHYVIPQWYAATFRVSYRAGKFEHPQVAPDYYGPEGWILSTWWRKK